MKRFLAFALLFCSLSPAAMGSAISTTYYDQFLFEVLGDCSDVEFMWFRDVFSWRPAKIGFHSDGRPLEAKVAIHLFKDGTYWADYREVAISGNSGSTQFQDRFTGNWKVNGNQIELTGLGVGVPGKYTDNQGRQKDAIDLTIKSNSGTSAVANLSKSGTNVGPRGLTAEEYCSQN